MSAHPAARYNRIVKGLAGFVCAVLLMLGCRKDIQNTVAVRQGILDYLARRPDLAAMDVSVSSVAFRKDEADATVFFRAKDGPAENGMQMKYVLERKGNQWVVKGRTGASGTGNPHGGAPSNGTPMGENPHGATTPALPPGHPPLPSKQAQPPLP
jgi:hypothetical protein